MIINISIALMKSSHMVNFSHFKPVHDESIQLFRACHKKKQYVAKKPLRKK